MIKRTLETIPGVPLGSSLKLDSPGLSSVVVSNSGLLEQTVDLEHLLVRGALGQLLDILSSSVESLLFRKRGRE